MDLKPLMGFDLGNQNQILEWVYSGETHMDSPFVSKMNFPVALPDVLNYYSNSEPTSIFSTNNTYYDPLMALNPNGFNMIETDQPPLQDLEILDDFHLDFLKFEHYIPSHDTTYPYDNEIPTIYYQQDDTMTAESPAEVFPQLQVEGNGLVGNQSSYGETVSVGYRSNRLTKSSSIGFGEISKYFYMTITDAAKEMNVGLTVLKKRCRELGISRWPHRKMKSLKSLIHNVQEELGKGTTDEEMQREVQSLEEYKRLMEQMPELKLSERTKKLRQACFKANYKRRRAILLQTSPPPYRA